MTSWTIGPYCKWNSFSYIGVKIGFILAGSDALLRGKTCLGFVETYGEVMPETQMIA